MGTNLESILNQVTKSLTYQNGINLIYGKYEAQKAMSGADENLNSLTLIPPTLNFDYRDMEGLPINLYFQISGDSIKMSYEFRVEAIELEPQQEQVETNNTQTSLPTGEEKEKKTIAQQIETSKFQQIFKKNNFGTLKSNIKIAKPIQTAKINQGKININPQAIQVLNNKQNTESVQIPAINMENAQPMLISDLEIVIHIKNEDGKETTETLKHNLLFARPQIASGERLWKEVDEFFAVKKAIEKGNVYITWKAKVQWVDISTSEMQENIKKPDYKFQPQIASVNGTIPIKIIPDSASYFSMFDNVKSLMCWDCEILNEKPVYFKDPFKDDAIYFLPQEYRIKALPNNAPDMSTEIVSENGERKVLMRFRLAPYIHPNAKRDAYKIFLKRKGKQYCEIRYGGYESATFKWDGEMANGKLYGKDGFTSISSEGDVEAAPESSFFIVMEAPADGLIKLLQEKIMGEGINIGKVFFTVFDGIKNEKKDLENPVLVSLDLHKLAGLQPKVEITECKWPHYVAKITNTGLYPIEIGGAAFSVLRQEKNQVKEAKHELKSNAVWPVTLASGESTSIELAEDQVEEIKHRKFPLFWKINEDYWTEFLCEPYHIRLPDSSLEEIMGKTNESATYEHKTWELSIIPNFNWYDYPNMTAVQVEIKTKYGFDEKITLMSESARQKISMVTNLYADQKTQQAGEQIFEYRVRAITTDGPKDPPWCDWATDSGDTLFIYSDDLTAQN